MSMSWSRVGLGQVCMYDAEKGARMQKGEALHAYQPILELHHIDKRLAFPVGTAIEQAVSTLHIIPLHRSKHLTHFASGTPVRDCEKAQGSQSSQCSLSLLPSFIQSVCSILAISSLKHIARVRASSSLLANFLRHCRLLLSWLAHHLAGLGLTIASADSTSSSLQSNMLLAHQLSKLSGSAKLACGKGVLSTAT